VGRLIDLPPLALAIGERCLRCRDADASEVWERVKSTRFYGEEVDSPPSPSYSKVLKGGAARDAAG
jgi:hypothetical protein